MDIGNVVRHTEDIVPLSALFHRLQTLLATGEPVRLAIDGRSASGKTTLADWLARRFGGQVFHMDDYFLQQSQRTPERLAEPGGNVDRERFSEEVIAGLCSQAPFSTRMFDCATMTLGTPHRITPVQFSIVEGAYSLHPALSHVWQVKVFLTVDAQTQRDRILARNGAARYERFLAEWIPMEERYFEAFDIQSTCDYLIDGNDLPTLLQLE